MHFIHLILLAFKFKGKGKLVLPSAILSLLVITAIFWGFNLLSLLSHNKLMDRLFTVAVWFLAAAVNSLWTRNYTISPTGEREVYEEEGKYIYIRVSIWTKIFIAFGLISLAGIIYDMLKH